MASMSQHERSGSGASRRRADVYQRQHKTDSGLALEREYGPNDRPAPTRAGMYPFVRGNTNDGYHEKLWVRDLYAGFGNAEEAAVRYQALMAGGASGVSIALDLPTQLGYDSDHPEALPEVGKVGLAADSLRDILDLFDGISLADAGVVFTVANGIGPVALAWFELLGRNQGADPHDYVIHLQNDPLKEFTGRGAFVHPIEPSVRLACDVVEYVARKGYLHWTPIGICGSQYRWGGGTAIHEIGFGLAAARVYIEELLGRGLHIDEFAPLLEMHLTADMDVFEEAAKFRAARYLWAQMMKEEYGAKLPESQQLRVSLQTGGYKLTAQEPLNNAVRVTLQALSAVLGGVERIGTLAIDEALSTPSEECARLAVQTQNILAYETSISSVVDPLGGSWFVESLTERLIEEIAAAEKEVKDQGGTIEAIRNGHLLRVIDDAAYEFQRELEVGDRIQVGVNGFARESSETTLSPFSLSDESTKRQLARLAQVRANRNSTVVENALGELEDAARAKDNVMDAVIECCASFATIGEIHDRLRTVYGSWEIENVPL